MTWPCARITVESGRPRADPAYDRFPTGAATRPGDWACAMTVFTWDGSHHDLDRATNAGRPVDWDAALAHVEAVCWKATQGATVADATFTTAKSEVLRRGKRFAAYHWITDRPLDAQIANLESAVVDKRIPLMIDGEEAGASVERIGLLRDMLRARGWRVTMSYLPRWFLHQLRTSGAESAQSFPLSRLADLAWVNSHYRGQPKDDKDTHPLAGFYTANGGDAHPGWAAEEGLTPSILQFGSRLVWAGIPTFADANAFRGPAAELDKWFFNPAPGAAPAPTPHPAPTTARPKVFLSRLRNGVRDSDSVRLLQRALNNVTLQGGRRLPVTGNFLAETLDEVKRFQVQKAKDPGDGALGPLQTKLLFQLAGIGVEIVDDRAHPVSG